MADGVRADLVPPLQELFQTLLVERVPVAHDVERGSEPPLLLPFGDHRRALQPVGGLDVVRQRHSRAQTVGPEPWKRTALRPQASAASAIAISTSSRPALSNGQAGKDGPRWRQASSLRSRSCAERGISGLTR